jgi:hypothetical protein
MQHNIEQTGLASGMNGRHASDRLRQQLSVPNDTKAAFPLCDQHGTIGQESH